MPKERLFPPAVEQRTLQLPGKEIVYTLKRSPRRRSIGLRIDAQGLTVNLPLRASERWLQEVLQQKARWVADKLHDWQRRQAPPQAWHDGAPLPFRGERFTLRLEPSLFPCEPALRGEKLHVYVQGSAGEAEVARQVSSWYRREAQQVFEECVAHFAPLLQVAPREIRLSDARTQWGSCTTRGVVRLNWQLIKLPLHLIDYVVVHELAHLIEMNHSARFWRVVASVCPDYQNCRAELRAQGIAG